MDDNAIRNIVITVVGALLIFFGICGNSLVAIAIWKKNYLRSTANYLLLNVALADITSLTFLPLVLVSIYGKFQQGITADLLCKFLISVHIPLTANFAAVFTLVVLSVEKYHAIVKPMKSGFRLREDTVKYAIIVVWTSAIAMTLPMYIFGKYARYKTKLFCDYDATEDAMSPYLYVLAAIVIFIPFIVISFCYFQIVRELYFKNKVAPQNVTTAAEDNIAKRKLVKLSLSITLALLVCFFPLALSMCLRAYNKEKLKSKYIQDFGSLLYVLKVVLNPFLYAFQSTNFRQAFKEMLKSKLCPCCK
ncbi:neuropeptide S receptor-like [Actinia tenebrosa]|uniref:Neuropeptide S receptor-like n=1 Tax=Actinia tenebrosa TaxID=6105 RepID=A0A6P8JET3_ACTTE|nr:neuropeptide S receptor-like [Actinia tenebrosa]